MGESPRPKIFTEKRGGKTVTIVKGLHTYGSARLEAIAKELKLKLACGGTVKDGLIEIQGDKRDPAGELLKQIIKR
jgi:translation initiation factor 1